MDHCADFDFAHHLRRVAIPHPGDDADLSAAIAFALERPLDPDRPLWECWVIEGLEGDRWAILMKVHHRLAGVTSPAHLLTRLCDDAPRTSPINQVTMRRYRALRIPIADVDRICRKFG